jgi:predicted regulator of Ras-like GTPase activity (Roadblock/LC7/MglB family)
MSIESLLTEVVSNVEGATGLIILDADGEAIAWYGGDGERLRLRGAYISVLLTARRALPALASLGQAGAALIKYDGASFVAREIDDDSMAVLELSPGVNIAEAMFHFEPFLQKLSNELR